MNILLFFTANAPSPSPTITLSLTDTIAVLGCITGIISLFLHFRQIWKERFSLKIHFCNDCFAFDGPPEYEPYLCEHNAFLHIRIENYSALPITIFAIKIVIDGKNVNFRNFKIPPFTLPEIFNSAKTKSVEEHTISSDTQLTFPLRLDSYDARIGHIIIQNCPYTDKESHKVTLTLKTAKGEQKQTSKIWKNRLYLHEKD